MHFPPLSEFAKQILIALSVLFGVELILQNWVGVPIDATLAWNPRSLLVNPWAVGTNYLVQGSNPFGFLFQLIALYFFLPPTQQHLGKKGILRLVGRIVVVNAVVGVLGTLSGAVSSLSSAHGLAPMITAMIVLFGLRRPDATIYLLVFPVKAVWIAWGSGLLALFSFLSFRNLSELLMISSWMTAFLYTKTGRRILKRYTPKSLRNLFSSSSGSKRKPNLTVHDGGKDDPWIH